MGRKKLLALFLCLVMICTMLPTWALAEEIPVAEIEAIQKEEFMDTESVNSTESGDEAPVNSSEEVFLAENTEELSLDGENAEGSIPDVQMGELTNDAEELSSDGENVEGSIPDVQVGELTNDTEESPEEPGELDTEQSAENVEKVEEDNEESNPTEEKENIVLTEDLSVEGEEVFMFAADADASSGTCGDNATWSIDTTTWELTITGTGAVSSNPWKTDYQRRIKSVHIGDGITSICYSAFQNCTALETVNFGNTLQSTGESAFAGCSRLKAVSLPDSFTDLGVMTFRNCTSLNSLNLGNKIKSIGYGAFSGDTALSSVTIPGSVTFAGDLNPGAFMDCTGLTDVTIEEGVTALGWRMFYGCTKLTAINIPGTIAEIPGEAFKGCQGLKRVDIQDGVVKIAFSAFENCTALETVNFGNTLESTDEGAFAGCSRLKAVSLPDSFADLGAKTFRNCTSLNSLNLGNKIKSIGYGAFSGDTALSSVTIPGSVTFAGDLNPGAFMDCTGLTDVTIEEGVTALGWRMFYGCTKLTAINIPGTIAEIPSEAFKGCQSLKRVDIQDGVVNINYSAFENCTALAIVHFVGEAPTISDSAFKKVTADVFYHPEMFGWTDEKLSNYGGNLTWIPGNPHAMYVDVSDPNAYYYVPVYWAASQGITSGTSPTTFSPGKDCTRGQIVTFLCKAMGSPEPHSMSNPFIDVKSSDYFYKPVLWAKENGVTSGTSATTFSPGKACTRGQIVTFLWKALGSPEPTDSSNPFTDVKTSDYFYKPVLWAKEKGVTSGTSATTFSPGKTCTRAQAMTFLYKATN